MNQLEKLQELCDDALIVAEKSKKPQQEVICALVTVIGKLTELKTKKPSELEIKAANYAALLRQGHSVNKANLAKTLDDLIMRNALDKVA